MPTTGLILAGPELMSVWEECKSDLQPYFFKGILYKCRHPAPDLAWPSSNPGVSVLPLSATFALREQPCLLFPGLSLRSAQTFISQPQGSGQQARLWKIPGGQLKPPRAAVLLSTAPPALSFLIQGRTVSKTVVSALSVKGKKDYFKLV